MKIFQTRLELHGPNQGDTELKKALRPWTSSLPWYWFTRRWRLQAVNFVFLRDTKVTKAGLESLDKFRNLLWLDLAGVKCLDPAALLTIGACRSLKILNLERTNMCDEWLPCLKCLWRLEWLGLVGTKVSRHAVWDLRRWLPRPTIVHNESVDVGCAATEKE